MQVLVYSPKINNRVRYTFTSVITGILGVPVHLTSDQEEYRSFHGPKICYANHALESGVFFQSRGLLFETGIKDQNITVFQWNDIPAFFSCGKTSAFPFDPFSAAFYLLSRYEEYLPTIRDSHDRFDAHQSLAYQNGFITLPVVDIWANKIGGLLEEKYQGFKCPVKKYNFTCTVDIDNAFAYKEKGLLRTAGAYFRDLLNFDLKEMGLRTKVLVGIEKDPYDTYEHLLEVQKKYKLRPIYFFLLADYGINDKNVPVQSRRFRSLIKSIADQADVGIHPSYGSNANPARLETEIRRLSKILNREITRSRQHFLKLTLPNTYRNLTDLDITDDYTMGFASEIGFRAGTCSPFYYFDLDLEVETRLRLHPFEVMDATLKYYMKLGPENAVEAVKPIIDQVRAVNGTFTILWHNESLSDSKQWKGWKSVFEEIIKLAVP